MSQKTPSPKNETRQNKAVRQQTEPTRADSGAQLTASLVQRAQQEPGSLSTTDVLALQRTNGNQSVTRLLAPARTVHQASGTWLARYPDAESGNFWEDLRQDTGTTMRDILSSNERALQQFEQDVGSGEGSSDSIAPDLVDFALDIAQATPAQKLAYKVLQRVYTQFTAVRSGSVQLATYTASVRDAHDAFQRSLPRDWSSVNEDSPQLFQDLKALMDNESADNQSSQRQQAITLLRSVDQNIPPYRRIMQPLIRGWVGSAQDQTWRERTIDLPDPAGFSTGYLRIYVDIVPDIRGNYLRHSFNAISLDDIDNPEGTKRAIANAWGNDFYLDELPFPGMIHLNMGSTMVTFRKTGREATQNLAGWDAGVVNVSDRFRESTIETRQQMYFDHIRPRVEHLQADD